MREVTPVGGSEELRRSQQEGSLGVGIHQYSQLFFRSATYTMVEDKKYADEYRYLCFSVVPRTPVNINGC